MSDLKDHVVRLNKENNRLRASINKYREFGLFRCLQMSEMKNKELKKLLEEVQDDNLHYCQCDGEYKCSRCKITEILK